MNFIADNLQWIKADWRAYKLRFALECLAWFISIACSLAMAITAPDVPLAKIYPFLICGCLIYTWAAYTRKSFGMLANYMLLSTIDSIALYRLLTH